MTPEPIFSEALISLTSISEPTCVLKAPEIGASTTFNQERTGACAAICSDGKPSNNIPTLPSPDFRFVS